MSSPRRLPGNEIRQSFLDFFAERGHQVVRSSPVVLAKDPTLLFANAGMNQFKDVFTGLETRDYSRATTAQKAIRAGGKHNDIDEVGRTPRHHTFFEMLGNFSFGDYFKQGAIEYALELLLDVWGIPLERLWFTVHHTDDDAEELWKAAGAPADRVLRFGDKDNFWEMGPTGPCGPCSEIHVYIGDDLAENTADLVNADHPRQPRDLEPRVHAVRPLGGRHADAAPERLDRHGDGPGARRLLPAGQALELRDRPAAAATSTSRRAHPAGRTSRTATTACRCA